MKVADTHSVEEDLPALAHAALSDIDVDQLRAPGDPGHPPRILLLYGCLLYTSPSPRDRG